MLSYHPAAIAAFQSFFERASLEIAPWLSDDVELRPPTYGKAWAGKSLVCRLLEFASAEFDGLVYTDGWCNGERYALRFEGGVGDKRIAGVDIVHLDRTNRIALIEIFARPPGAVLALRDRMGTHVAKDPMTARLMGLSA